MSTDPVTLAHAAAEAISALCAALDDCAREVEERGGKRTARDYLMPAARASAVAAVSLFLDSTPRGSPSRSEARDILGATIGLYVRPWMALRVVTLATEAAR